MAELQAVPLADTVPLSRVEGELARQLHEGKEDGEAPARRARMSNLVIFCSQAAEAEDLALAVPNIVAVHPARVFLLVGDTAAPPAPVAASLNVWCHLGESRQRICSEQVTLRAGGSFVDRLPFAVRGLLIGDLPLNLWWACPAPPPLAGPLLYELADHAQQIIYDSVGWPEPARAVAATSSWLSNFERTSGIHWRVASDLNWRRLKYWRRLGSQALDPSVAPGALESIREVLVEHGPHAVVQAWQLVSLLAFRLHWRVQAGRFQPGKEISFKAQASHGSVDVRIRRLSEGRAEIRRVRLACKLAGKPGALNLVAQDANRLAAVPENLDVAPRTITTQPQTLADLVARQLSDREHDPVFRETMAVAKVFAQSILG